MSSLVSTGDKLDVSGNDLPMWWDHDQETRFVVLYLESFGIARKFARLARRVTPLTATSYVLAELEKWGRLRGKDA